MTKLKFSLIVVLSVAMFLAGCATWSKTQKGAVVGTAAGGGVGTIIGKASGNTALGTIIGAAVGGATGAIIGHQMDKQAEEIRQTVPGAKVERVGEGIVIEFSSKVLFGFDESVLSSSAQKNLDDLVTVLNSYADTDIEIQGHTDSRGTLVYNQALSERRAKAVSSYLSSRGIAYSRLTTKGFGEEIPEYTNSSEGGREQNRRVEFLITANAKMKAEAENASK